MRLKQYRLPFPEDEETIMFDNLVSHIGIQIPDRPPVEVREIGENVSPEIKINDDTFLVNEHDILEFDELEGIKFKLAVALQNQTLPAGTIIDVVYKTTEEE